MGDQIETAVTRVKAEIEIENINRWRVVRALQVC